MAAGLTTVEDVLRSVYAPGMDLDVVDRDRTAVKRLPAAGEAVCRSVRWPLSAPAPPAFTPPVTDVPGE